MCVVVGLCVYDWVCACVCMRVWICVCECVCARVCACCLFRVVAHIPKTHTHAHTHRPTHTHICARAHTHTHTHTLTRRPSPYVNAYVHVRTQTHTHKHRTTPGVHTGDGPQLLKLEGCDLKPTGKEVVWPLEWWTLTINAQKVFFIHSIMMKCFIVVCNTWHVYLCGMHHMYDIYISV